MIIREGNAIPKSLDEEKRQITFRASSGDLDRDKERIKTTAYEKSLPTYMENNVVLAGHQTKLSDGQPSVVGRAVKVWTNDEGLFFVCEFANTALAENYYQLYKNGFMKACSVGFVPEKWHDQAENGSMVRVYDEVQLLEISLVAVPSNRAALARSKANKLAFVGAKRDERILDDIRKDYAERGLDFDRDCENFCELLLRGEYHDGEVYLPRASEEANYADLVGKKI